jgi:hypothetical protein
MKDNIKKERKAVLKLNHLNSLISFERWIRTSLSVPKEKKIPLNHLEKYLGHIQWKLQEEVGANKDEWNEVISSLLDNLEKKKND